MKSRILKISIFLGFIFILGNINSVSAQNRWFQNSKNKDRLSFQDQFQFKVFTSPVKSDDSVRVIFYAQLAYDLLQFVLTDTIFHANYELTLLFRNRSGDPISSKIVKNTVSTSDYAETNSRTKYSRERIEFILMPGNYSLFIELIDLETKRPLKREDKLIVPDFRKDPFTTSPVLFFNAVPENPAYHSEVFPSIPPVRSLTDTTFVAYFHLFTDSTINNLKIKYSIIDRRENKLFVQDTVIAPDLVFQPIIMYIDQKLTFSRYSLLIEITDGKKEVTLQEYFYVKWGNHPASMPDLNLTINAMQYIMDRREWTQLNELEATDQKEMLDAFWKERDPNPNTPENELEEEYFQRVTFANQNFSVLIDGQDGWRTDRGRIYIIYGPPSDVERPPTTGNQISRYEIWFYSNIQKRFVFLDKFDSGEFRLISQE
jgi:GWxTD domain-containing protein